MKDPYGRVNTDENTTAHVLFIVAYAFLNIVPHTGERADAKLFFSYDISRYVFVHSTRASVCHLRTSRSNPSLLPARAHGATRRPDDHTRRGFRGGN